MRGLPSEKNLPPIIGVPMETNPSRMFNHKSSFGGGTGANLFSRSSSELSIRRAEAETSDSWYLAYVWTFPLLVDYLTVHVGVRHIPS